MAVTMASTAPGSAIPATSDSSENRRARAPPADHPTKAPRSRNAASDSLRTTSRTVCDVIAPLTRVAISSTTTPAMAAPIGTSSALPTPAATPSKLTLLRRQPTIVPASSAVTAMTASGSASPAGYRTSTGPTSKYTSSCVAGASTVSRSARARTIASAASPSDCTVPASAFSSVSVGWW